MNPSTYRVFAPFYSSALAWNYALGMTQLLIPLYARDLGYSGVAIGSLIALPIVVQMVFNLVGGAWTDRVGGMNISLAAFAATAAAGFMFAASYGIQAAFYALGAFAFLFSFALLPVQRWSQAESAAS